ncbi:MAG: hypothetical protein Q9227_006493 [Pyrenula ochraceoflavens]
MYFSSFLSLAALASPCLSQAIKGFNTGSTFTDGSAKTQQDFENEFRRAQSLPGASGFSSFRLFTTIQGGTTNTPLTAIPAAISTKTNLLLGLWGSAGQTGFDNELAALKSAISQYGQSFADLVVGISVGSEDLYRISPTGIENMSGVGAGPNDIVNYINQLRSTISGTSLSSKAVGHVDTWTAWVNSSNFAVTGAVDFVGVDAYPYFQNTEANGINAGSELFFEALNATIDNAQGKDVWVTETGWPVSGATSNQAVPSTQNAQTYWDQVGCQLFGARNTFWFTLQDAQPTTPNPSFGIIGSDLSSAPLFDLTCGASSNPSSSSSSSGPSASSSASSSSASNTAASSSSASSLTSSATTATATSVTATAPTSPAGPSPPSTSSCATTLGAGFEFPHLIVPVNSAQPSTQYGTTYSPHFSPTISSLFNFDIPSNDAGKTCSLVFLLPAQDQLRTSSFTLSGAGGISVNALSSPATNSTTFNSVPSSSGTVGNVQSVTPGNSYVVASAPCAAGQAVGYEVTATETLDLEYFQDSDQPPIGLYVTVC